MFLTISFAISIVNILTLSILYPHRARNPLFLFICFNWYFSLGTLTNLQTGVLADEHHAIVLLIANCVPFLYLFLFYNGRAYRRTERLFEAKLQAGITQPNMYLIWFLLLTSCVVSFIYYRFFVGYNLLYPVLIGAELDFTTLRLQTYAGDTYTWAGVVNQFKNTLLPIAFFAIGINLYFKRKWTFLVLFLVIFTPLFLWSILGTGQRAYLFFSVAGFLYSFLVMGRRISPTIFILVGLTFFALFSVFSAALGRVDEGSLLAYIKELSHRLFDANQTGAVFGFRYVYGKDATLGSEWLRSLLGFLPGVSGSTLSNEVFEQVYGSRRGTIPVSLWTSIYYNFGLIGIVPVGLVVLKLVEAWHNILRIIPASTAHILMYSFMCFYLMILPVASPLQIVNNGALAIVLFFVLGAIRIRNMRVVFRTS